MADKLEELEPFVFAGKLDIPNTYTAGKMGSRFLIELRDNKKIMGIKCPNVTWSMFLPGLPVNIALASSVTWLR
jgi:hypothetical protein